MLNHLHIIIVNHERNKISDSLIKITGQCFILILHENHVNASLLSCVLRQDWKDKSRAFYQLLYIESESRPIFRVILQSLRKPEVSLVKDEREKRVLSKLQHSLEILLTTRTCSGEESRWRVLVPSSQMDPSRRFLVFILGRFQTRKEREAERCWEREGERERESWRSQTAGRTSDSEGGGTGVRGEESTLLLEGLHGQSRFDVPPVSLPPPREPFELRQPLTTCYTHTYTRTHTTDYVCRTSWRVVLLRMCICTYERRYTRSRRIFIRG